MRAVVIVLGDIGRSPRMQYHALALAASGAHVDLVGHAGSRAGLNIEENPRIQVHRLPRPRAAGISARRSFFLLMAAWRGVTESARLLHLIGWRLPKADVILVQTPPAIPTLVLAWVAARARGERFIIDWHNFSDRMLALRLGDASPIVWLTGWFEKILARRADAHFVVSTAMQHILERDWHAAPVRVFRDAPAERFRPLCDEDRADARRELLALLDVPDSPDAAIVISPTSWTADEDFDILLGALALFDDSAPTGELLVVLTGDGPRRRAYEDRIGTLNLAHVIIRTIWLESEAYPRLLAAADLGVCLHQSVSGVDLPMKIADCFGVGLPVCALDYGPCLREVIRPGINGLLFSDAATLAQQLRELFVDRDGTVRLSALRQGVMRSPRDTWEQRWNREARPMLLA